MELLKEYGYYLVSTATLLQESAIHKIHTKRDFTLFPTRELIVQLGQPMDSIRIGFSTLRTRREATLRKAYDYLQYLLDKQDGKSTVANYFYPSRYNPEPIKSVELLRDVSQLGFNQLALGGGGRRSRIATELYMTISKYYDMVIDDLGVGQDSKTRIRKGIREVEFKCKDMSIEKLLDILMGELLDNKDLVPQIDYTYLTLTDKPLMKIDTYVMYKGDYGDARYSKLIEESFTNIFINSEETIGEDIRFNENFAYAVAYTPAYRNHSIVVGAHISRQEMLVHLRCKSISRYEMLFESLKYAPLIEQFPEIPLADYNGDGRIDAEDIVFLEEDLYKKQDLDIKGVENEYNQMYRDVQFISVQEFVKRQIEQGLASSIQNTPIQASNTKEMLENFEILKGQADKICQVNEMWVPEWRPGDLEAVLTKCLQNTSRINNEHCKILEEFETKLNNKSIVDKINRIESKALDTKLGQIGDNLDLYGLYGNLSKENIQNEIETLATLNLEDSLLIRELRIKEILKLDITRELYEEILGKEKSLIVAEFFRGITFGIASNLLELTVSTNRNKFVDTYKSLKGTEDQEVLISKLNDVYQDIMV